MFLNRGALRVCLLVFIGLVLAAAIAVGGVLCYQANGRVEKSHRLSMFLHMCQLLREYAVEHGRYPERIEDAVKYRDELRWLDIGGIEYRAAGQIYTGDGGHIVFYEKRSRSYGFEKGWFVFYQDSSWSFSPPPVKQL